MLPGRRFRSTPGNPGMKTRSAVFACSRASTMVSPTHKRSMRLPPISLPNTSVRKKSSSACATGASAASVIGAHRFRSSTAMVTPPADTPAAAWCRYPKKICRWCCPKTWCRTAAATRSTKTRAFSTSSARPAARMPNARPTRWTPSSTRPGTTCATRHPTAHPTAHPAARRRWSMPATATGCRWINTSAVSSTRCCICSTRASGPR